MVQYILYYDATDAAEFSCLPILLAYDFSQKIVAQ